MSNQNTAFTKVTQEQNQNSPEISTSFGLSLDDQVQTKTKHRKNIDRTMDDDYEETDDNSWSRSDSCLSPNGCSVRENVQGNFTENIENGPMSRFIVEGMKVFNPTYNFEDILPETVARNAYKNGWEKPTPFQQHVIEAFKTKKHVILQSPSGTGKTGALLFGVISQLDLSLPYNQAIIISNTVDLATQTWNVANILGADLLGESQPIASLVVGETHFNPEKGNKTKIIVASVGKLTQMLIKGSIAMDNMKMFVIDEADIVISSFRDPLMRITAKFPRSGFQLAVISATMTDNFKNACVGLMVDREKISITTKHDKVRLEGIKNFYIKVDGKSSDEMKNSAIGEIVERTSGTIIVFVNEKKKIDSIIKYLKPNFDDKVVGYSGDLSVSERAPIIAKINEKKFRVVITSDILCRGIDATFCAVINYDLPKAENNLSGETYYHRIGRAGRMGKTGVAISFLSGKNEEEMFLIELKKKYEIELEEFQNDSFLLMNK